MNNYDTDWKQCSVDALNFSFRTQVRLMAHNIQTIGHLTEWSAQRLMAIYGFGQNCVTEVGNALAAIGLSLAEDTDTLYTPMSTTQEELAAEKEVQRKMAADLRLREAAAQLDPNKETVTSRKWKVREPIIQAAIADGKNIAEIAAILSISSASLKSYAETQGWVILTAHQQQEEERRTQIQKVLADGKTLEQVAKHFAVSPKRILQYLGGQNIELPKSERQQWNEHRKHYVTTKLACGTRISDIAAGLGLSRQRLYSLMDKWGLEKPPAPARCCIQCGKEFNPSSYRQKKCQDCPSIPRLTAEERGKKHRLNWERPEYRAKMLAHMQSPEYKARMSERAIARWSSPEFRERVKDKIWSAERRQQQAQMQRANWQNPDYLEKQQKARAKSRTSPASRERMLSLWQDPEFRAKMSKVRAAQWSDPAFRMRQVAALARGKAKKRSAISSKAFPTEGILPLQVNAVQGILDL